MAASDGSLLTLAWRVVPRLPGFATRAVFDGIALAVHALRLGAVTQLEKNIARVRPDLSRKQLRKTSRAGMRSYLRYYGEVFALRAMTPQQIKARVRTINVQAPTRHFEAEQAVVAALGHAGNWDLAGAWAGQNLARVLTVAEILEPAELFEEFLAFRSDLGMDVIGLSKDGSVFRTLLRKAKSHPYLVPLLADRDLSRTSIEVDVGGHTMRVAAGPAALAVALKAPLMQIFIRHERLSGARRRAAGSPWGIVIEFTEIALPPRTPEDDRVRVLTQAWTEVLMDRVARYPDQWHMLQKVFSADLDTERLARSHAEAEQAGDS